MDFLHSKISNFTLPNGLRVLTIPMPARRSITAGVWVLTGSASERQNLMGISHFLEHMVFKGTTNFNAKQIVLEIERRGGSIDAYTAKDEVCYYSVTLDDDVEVALKILSELVCSPALRVEDMELEKNVILSEMCEVRDDPAALTQEIFPLILFGNRSYGRPILGSPKTVKKMNVEELRLFWKEHYSAKNIILGAAGAVDPQKFVQAAHNMFYLSDGEPPITTKETHTIYDGKIVAIPQDAQQVHFTLGVRTFPYRDDRRYTLAILDAIVGRGSASRLFQRIREQLAIAYVVQSFSEMYDGAGFWGIYAASAPENMKKLITEIVSQLQMLVNNGIDNDELDNVKNFLRGRLLLSAESPWSVLARAVESEVHIGRTISIDETIQRLMDVNAAQVVELANELFTPTKLVGVALGDVRIDEIPDVGMTVVQKGLSEIMPD